MPAQERFVASWRRYLDSVVLQAERRTKSYVCTIDEYLTARRDNIGSDPSMALLEICLQIDIPHEVMEHPAIASLTSYTADLNTLGNVCHDHTLSKRNGGCLIDVEFCFRISAPIKGSI